MRRTVILAALVLGLLAPGASAAGLRLTPAETGQFPQRAYVLTLPTKVSLNPGQVAITENGAAVSGLSVQPSHAVGEGHFGTVLIIDTSESMRGRPIEAAMEAARSFARYRDPLQPLGVVTFDSVATTALPLSTDSAAIDAALASPPPLGAGAHIVQALSVGLQMLARAHVIAGSIVLVSDGAQSGQLSPQASVQRTAQVTGAALAQNVRVYAVGVHDKAFAGGVLQSLASAAGGTYAAVDSTGLASLFSQLGTELSDQYLVRYRSQVPPGSPVYVAARVAGQPGAAFASYSAPRFSRGAAGGSSGTPHTSFWHTTWAAVLACIICAVLIGLAVMTVLSPRRSVGNRVGAFVATEPAEPTKSWTAALLERTFTDEGRGLARGRHWAKLAEEVELARIGMSVEQIVALTALATILSAWLLAIATGSVVGAALALCVPLAVRIAISARVGRERRAFDDQLPDNLQVVASAMRAGHTFVGALAVMAEDAAEPSRRELRRVLADEALGVPLADALSNVTTRMNSREFERVALVASLQRETGGNTAEVIDSLTQTIRERLDLRRLVHTLTAQGRLSGFIICALPIVLMLAIFLVAPHYLHPLFHQTAGVIALALGSVMLIAGVFIIRRIVNIDV